ncbi:hypothetical protein JKG68_16130 [Microvirga aerilata]|uniref:Glycosyltransferase RgtA/B/C/D-like domain-containing protein n=1 Tax=Microvirga aerilata TaxID=670292 RepID=A0A936Z7N6_9HYPH|nr:hypothetical protein [Microvirga aerilata]MBL0405498.1 hypothetical protein [Microvirga aerilata]
MGKSRLALLAVSAIPIWLYFQLFREMLIDDTLITLQYARTLRDYGVWGFFPWEVTNTATSPLNVILTAAIGFGVHDLVQAALTLATLEAVALLVLLLLLSKHITSSSAFGAFAFLAVVGNPLLLSTIGLEPLLYITLLVACVFAFLTQHYTSVAILSALLTLTRPDGVLLFPIMMIAALLRYQASENLRPGQPREEATPRWRAQLRLIARLGLVYALCLAPWYIFSWIHLGSIVPSTFGIKLSQSGTWGGFNFAHGALLYFLRYPQETLFSLLLMPFAVLCLKLENRQAVLAAALLCAFSATYFAAYAALGVPPYHWYFVPVVIPGVILGVLGLLTAAEQLNAARHSLIRSTAVILSPAAVVFGLIYLFGRGDLLTQPPIHTNWATHQQYREIGLWLHSHVEPDANVRVYGGDKQVSGEIGTMAFYAERRLADVFSCRLANHRILEEARTLRGLQGALMRANFFWLRADTACVLAKYELHMGSRAGPPTGVLPDVLKWWEINTHWVPEGRVVLTRSETPNVTGSETAPLQKSSP